MYNYSDHSIAMNTSRTSRKRITPTNKAIMALKYRELTVVSYTWRPTYTVFSKLNVRTLLFPSELCETLVNFWGGAAEIYDVPGRI